MGEKSSRLNSIVFARAVVAIIVMLAHANLIIDPSLFHGFFIQGWCGVDFFFILSGFLVAWTYWNNSDSCVHWLGKRFARIYPTYWIYTTVVIAFHFIVGKIRGGKFVSWIGMDFSGIARSMLLLPTDVAVNEMPIIPPAWTLAYEVLFYLVVSFFVKGRKRVFWNISLVWLSWILMGRLFGTGSLILEFICAPLFVEFYFGMCIVCLLRMTKRYGKTMLHIGLILLGVSWIGTNLGLQWFEYIDRVFRFGIPFSMIIYGMVAMEMDGKQIKVNKVWKCLSDSSFSLYLIHYPLLLLLNKVGNFASLPGLFVFFVSVSITVIAGILGYRIVEKPMCSFLRGDYSQNNGVLARYICLCMVGILFMGIFQNPQMIFRKKLVGVFIGDSITEQGYYLRALEKGYPIKTINYGVAGATYGDCGSDISLLHEIVDNLSVQPDFIFVLCGTNDWGNNVLLGRSGDLEENSFYGGLQITFSKLRKKYPNTPIIVSTILQRNWSPSEQYPQPMGMDENGNGYSIEEFNKAIVYMAHKYGCKVVDAYGESGITMDNILRYTKDGVHLNEIGGEKYADYIAHEIENCVYARGK